MESCCNSLFQCSDGVDNTQIRPYARPSNIYLDVSFLLYWQKQSGFLKFILGVDYST